MRFETHNTLSEFKQDVQHPSWQQHCMEKQNSAILDNPQQVQTSHTCSRCALLQAQDTLTKQTITMNKVQQPAVTVAGIAHELATTQQRMLTLTAPRQARLGIRPAGKPWQHTTSDTFSLRCNHKPMLALPHCHHC
jgi:malonyl CoA-acyl carrier protein transacylase